MRLLVFGDRNWEDPKRVEFMILGYWDQFGCYEDEFVVISGGAPGADTHAREACEKHNFDFIEYPAKWNIYGRAAGIIRNQQMIDEGKPTDGIGFHKDISNSKGSKDMLQRLTKHGIPCHIIEN